MKDVTYVEASLLLAPEIEHLMVIVADLAAKIKLVDDICDAVLSGSVLIFSSKVTKRALDQHLKQKHPVIETECPSVTGYTTPTVSLFVACDALARGVRMSNVAVLINLGLPPSSNWYTQRVGRCCGTNQNANVVAVNVVEPDEAKLIADVEKVCGIQMMQVSGERAVLQCTFAFNMLK
jgi:superfamily II DNA/RNA helicase